MEPPKDITLKIEFHQSVRREGLGRFLKRQTICGPNPGKRAIAIMKKTRIIKRCFGMDKAPRNGINVGKNFSGTEMASPLLIEGQQGSALKPIGDCVVCFAID